MTLHGHCVSDPLATELTQLRAEESARPALCPDWCRGGCRREWRERRIAELERLLNA